MFGDLDCHESILDVALLFSAAFETSTSRQPKMKTIFFSASERKCQFVVTHNRPTGKPNRFLISQAASQALLFRWHSQHLLYAWGPIPNGFIQMILLVYISLTVIRLSGTNSLICMCPIVVFQCYFLYSMPTSHTNVR